MEDDIDIYEDLPSFETKDCQANKELTEECSKLREENAKLKGDVAKLGANMSSLMKTAKAEIARKDRMIAQLRQELDNAAFRRGNYGARRKQNINNPKVKKSEQNTEKAQQTLLVKQEALQENAATELDDISDVEDMEDADDPAPTDQQHKLTSTVFGARLKNKLLLELEAERIKKEEARIALLTIPVKAEKVEDTELGSRNGFVKKEDSKDASQDTSNALMEKMEVPVVSSVPHSTARISQEHQEDDNPCHRRAPKRNLPEKRDYSVNAEQPKRRRVEEERYCREEDARQHHNGNFKYDDVRYNFNGFENNDYSKSSTKFTDPRRTGHSRDDYDRARHKVRDGRSKSTYRSNGFDPRYNERRPDRHIMEESRAYSDRYEKRREDGWSRESDNSWFEYSRQTDERDKIEGKVGGRSEYTNYNNHHQLEWNLKRLGCKSRSPEKYRSHSGSRRSREKEFDKRRSKRSRSTDKFINAKSTVDERRSGQERQSTRAKNSKDFEVEVRNRRDTQPEDHSDFSRDDPPNTVIINKIVSSEIAEDGLLLCPPGSSHVDIENGEAARMTLEKLVSQVETPNGRITALEHDSELASIQSTIPKPAALGSGLFPEEKRREDRGSREGDNWFEYSREIDELRDKNESKVGGRSNYNNYNSHHQMDRNLKRLGCKSRSPEKYGSHSDSTKSREKEFDKRRSKRSKSTDKFINAKDERESGKDRRSTRVKDSKDIKDSKEVEVKNNRDAQPEVPPDFARNGPSNELSIDKISSSEIAENGVPMCSEEPSHVDIENAESVRVTLEKLISQVEIPDGRIASLENDSEVASIQSTIPELAVLGSGSSREEKGRECDNNCIEYGREFDELRDKFESNVGGSSECNNYNNLKRLGCKSRSPGKNRSHSDSRRSREKEVDKRRSKRSRSTDKFINAKSTVDERESGKELQSTRVKNSKDFEVEVRHSRDTQPEVPPDFSTNGPPKEVAIDKISLSEIAENGSPLCTEGPSHVDIENAASARVTLEKLVSQVEIPDGQIAVLENDSVVSSIQSATPEPAAPGSGSFREGKRREDDNNCAEYSREIDELRDKFASSDHNDYNSVKRLGCKSRSPGKNRSHSDSRRSREKEVDKRRSKRSRSTDKFIKAKSTVDERESGKELQSTQVKNSKDFEVEVRHSRDTQPEVPPDFSTNGPPKEVAIDKISSSEIAENGSHLCTEESGHVDIENAKSVRVTLEKLVSQVETPDGRIAALENDPEVASTQSAIPEPAAGSNKIAKDVLPLCTEGPAHVDIENAEPAGVTLEKLVSKVETPDRWIAELENDSEVASIPSEIPKHAALGSGSFREEKIENIEKFIKDYQENEEPCLPIADRESEEREKLGDSTSSIVDTLSMDVEESAADEKSDNGSKNPPEKLRTDIKDVAGDKESTIPKTDVLAVECTNSPKLKTLEDKKITPELSDIKGGMEKHLTDKVAVLKLTKYRPRIPCAPIVSRYSRRKQSVLADSGSSKYIVKSQSSTNTEGDNKSKKEIKTRRIATEEPSVQSGESGTKKSDSKIFIPKKQIEDANILTGKNANAVPPETKNTIDDSPRREDAECRVENSESNFISVSSSGSNILQQAKTSSALPAKVDAAPKSNNVQEPVELRETPSDQITTPAAVPSTDSRLSNRKKALPKEVDCRAKPAAKQYNIIVTARRRRPVQLEDSCIARTLVPSVHDVNSNESVKTVCAKVEVSEPLKLVSEPAIRGRKRRLIDK